jgi:molybdenum cofactor cytidylyltransferase
MTRAPSLCAVILAAGESSRMGRDKALLPWPPAADLQSASGETFLSAAIRALNPWNDMVMVVAGKNEAALAPIAYTNGASIVLNPSPEEGQFSSLRVGLREVLNHGRDAAMVTLVDRPPAQAATLETLYAEFQDAAATGKWAVIPEHAGRHGHPILLSRELIEAILKAPATSTARAVLHQHKDRIQYVPVEDAAVFINVNTPEDYLALQKS